MMFERSFIGPGALSSLMPALWRQQVEDWPKLRDALVGLRRVQTKTIRVGGSTVVAQFNPARQASASAQVDAASLAARPCFLCVDNLPKSQCAIIYRKDWLILCNPAPIFEPHFTITSMTHQPQRLDAAVPVMLDLAQDLNGNYTLFYNGPGCGASAPDHLHLQAAPVAVLPHEKELVRHICSGRTANQSGWIDWMRRDPVRIGVSRPGQRPAIFLLGRSRSELLAELNNVLVIIGSAGSGGNEPMANLFVAYADECWTIWLYPRRAHRPTSYGHGPDDFLVSPGAVDVAGMIIVPREADFNRLNEDIVSRIYDEVLITQSDLDHIRQRLQNGRQESA